MDIIVETIVTAQCNPSAKSETVREEDLRGSILPDLCEDKADEGIHSVSCTLSFML